MELASSIPGTRNRTRMSPRTIRRQPRGREVGAPLGVTKSPKSSAGLGDFAGTWATASRPRRAGAPGMHSGWACRPTLSEQLSLLRLISSHIITTALLTQRILSHILLHNACGVCDPMWSCAKRRKCMLTLLQECLWLLRKRPTCRNSLLSP